MRRAGVEPAQPEGGCFTGSWARRCPADAWFQVARAGVEPAVTKVRAPPRSGGRGRFADLRTAPCLLLCSAGRPALGSAVLPGVSISALDGIWTRDLLRDRQASTPGCSTRASIKVAQVGVEPTASLVLSQGGLPVAYRAAVAPDGVEPSFPGCGPSVVAVGPRGCVIPVESPGFAPGFPACGAGVVLLDHDPVFPKAEAVGLEPTSGFQPPPVFRTGSSSGRMASVVKLRRLELNQHEDLQRVSSYR